MKRGIIAFAAVAAMSMGAATAGAASLSSPGWINGSNSNPQDNFTVNTNNGFEIGLRAKYRHNPATIAPTGPGNNTYTVVAGPETNATSGNNGSSTGAAWNYEFSIINTNGVPLNDPAPAGHTVTLTATLTITDPNGHTASVDPLQHWGDNTGYDYLTSTEHDSSGNRYNSLTDGLAQNSENPSFGDFPLAAYYSQYTTGTYTFKLDVSDQTGALLATDTIHVNVVPVPLPKAAYAGLGLIAGLGVLGGLKRRQRKLA